MHISEPIKVEVQTLIANGVRQMQPLPVSPHDIEVKHIYSSICTKCDPEHLRSIVVFVFMKRVWQCEIDPDFFVECTPAFGDIETIDQFIRGFSK